MPTSGYDAISDAKDMLKILEKEWDRLQQLKSNKRDVILNDVNNDVASSCDVSDAIESETATLERHHGCSVTNGEIWNNFSTLMTKIDVTFGAWGHYNYYRMEV